MVALSSEATVTKVSTKPPTMPPSISGTVMRQNVSAGGTPRLIDASSRLGSICCRIAPAERTENGSLRTM